MSIIIGAQLYTLRDALKKQKNHAAVLRRLAEIGYPIVQCSGFEYRPDEFKQHCDALNLSVKLTHTEPERLLNDTERVIEEHKLLGCPYVGLGFLPLKYHSPEGARKFLRDYDPAMRAFAGAGLKFMYHNHSFEFARQSGERIFDVFVNESDPALLGFTLDVFWVQHAGADVRELVRQLSGRVDCVHYKDMAITRAQQRRFAAVGSGNMNWRGIAEACAAAGTKFAFVEQDNCYGRDPFDELAASWSYLESLQK
ncbi:MAG: sugar phosphate isomerase/epimerase [Oscillospiraceae bacterium]|jgi:sugar phosphate isomerase/epimerase|nr:sugar phosphate isomerase/epimerase [Oscillospiraceae bacterium]